MEDFKERLKNEQKELQEKMIKLSGFLGSDKSEEIDPRQYGLLHGQLSVMTAYNDILLRRIKLL